MARTLEYIHPALVKQEKYKTKTLCIDFKEKFKSVPFLFLVIVQIDSLAAIKGF